MATLLFHPHQYLINKLGLEVKREIGTVRQMVQDLAQQQAIIE